MNDFNFRKILLLKVLIEIKILEDYWNWNIGFINAICQNINKQDIFSEFLNTDI